MSTDQAALDQDWTAREQQPDTESMRKEVLQGGARYGKPSERATKEVRGPTNQCLSCGASVKSGVARVVGDEDGCTPVCGDCDDVFQSTVSAVSHFYGGGRR